MDTLKKTSSYRRIQVYISESEEKIIKAKASESGLSMSAYLRAAGLRRKITSVRDHAMAQGLMKVAADLGRLGGLLKHWLTQDGQVLGGVPRTEIAQEFRELVETRKALHRVIRREGTPGDDRENHPTEEQSES